MLSNTSRACGTRKIRANIRELDGDIAARSGGDEMVVLVRHGDDIDGVAARLQYCVFQAIHNQGAGVSVGAARFLSSVFVDGVEEGSLANLIETPRPTVTVLNVGRSGIPNASARLKGSIDELRIWTVARSATDIGKFRTASIAGSAPGLAANWTFGEGSGQLVHDSVGSVAPAFLGGTSNVEAADPSWSTDVPFH